MIYKFHDGYFKFYTAYYGSWANDIRKVFRVRTDTTPAQRAKEKDIKFYDCLVPSTETEINRWIATHPGFDVLNIGGRDASG